ncbi:MAG: peptide ABC transporter ATPase [Peptococcaceae bacterium 1109]|nr:MAG: peptide ABC transporter ATPase [Peptococcaceae bacterium 1109]
MAADVILDVQELRAYYRILKGDVKAVDGVTFQVVRGEILGIAGESGCGKSTLAHTLMLRKPPLTHISGKAVFLGQDIMAMGKEAFRKRRLQDISIIPQYALDALSPTKTIGTFFADLVREHGLPADSAFFERVRERLRFVNLDPEVLDKYPIELSGGMKQRVIMVISTILNPALVIADEITSALDVSSQRFAASLLVELRDKGIIGSAMFITHDLAILYQIADRLLIMYGGHVVETGPVETIVHGPRHPYTQALLSSLPKVGVQIKDQRLEGIKGTPPELLNIGPGCRFRARCPYRTQRCEETPATENISPEHSIACWNYRDIGGEQVG